MADKIIFEVVATAKGVKVVQQQTDKLATSTDRADKSTKKLDKSRDAYNRREKGAANISSNQTKNFSKMQQGIDGGGGSGGLVRAYALLAANVFALTAAFGVLSRSAQIDTLTQSMEVLSTTGGTFIKNLAKDMQEASGFAIDLAQGFAQVSLASSAGLSTTEIEGLTKVAKGAAISLGRNLPDAMDRIFRGAIKLEPEILDEIGLFVRVDEAAQKYARNNNKVVSSLTQVEKRQAFLNEILDQGLRKFSEYAEEIKPDPYVRLGAALQDIAQGGLSIVNSVFGPLLNFLAESKGVLTAVFGVLVFSLIKKAIPALGQFNMNLAQNAKDAADNARAYTLGVKQTTTDQVKADNEKLQSIKDRVEKERVLTGKMKGRPGQGKEAVETRKALQTEMNGEKRLELLKKRQLQIEKQIKSSGEKQQALLKQDLVLMNKEIRNLERQKELTSEIARNTRKGQIEPATGSLTERRQEKLDIKANRAGIIASGAAVAENQGMRAGFAAMNAELKDSKDNLGKFGKAAVRAQGSISILGTGLSRVMMILGPWMMAFSILSPILISFGKAVGFGSEESTKLGNTIDKLSDQTEKLAERFDKQVEQSKAVELSFREQNKAVIAYNKNQEETSVGVKKLAEEFAAFQAQLGFFTSSWEAIKSGFNMDNETLVMEQQLALITGSIDAAFAKGDSDKINLFTTGDNALEGADAYISSLNSVEQAERQVLQSSMDMSEDRKKILKESVLSTTTLEQINKRTATGSNKNRIELTRLDKVYLQGLVKLKKAEKDKAAASETLTKDQEKVIAQAKDQIELDKKRVAAFSALESTLKGAEESIGKFNQSFAQTTKVDDLLGSFKQLEGSLKEIDTLSTTDRAAFFKDFKSTDNPFAKLFEDTKDTQEAYEARMKLIINQLEEFKRVTIEAASENKRLTTEMKQLNSVFKSGMIDATRIAKNQTKIAQNQTKIEKVNLNALLINNGITEETAKQRLADLENITNRVDREKMLTDSLTDQAAISQIKSGLDKVAAKELEEKLLAETEIERAAVQTLKLKQQQFNVEKQLTSLLKIKAEQEAKLQRLAQVGSVELDPAKTAQLEIDAARERMNMTIKEAEIKHSLLMLEKDLLKARLIALDAELRSKGQPGIDNLADLNKTLDNNALFSGQALAQQIENAKNKFRLDLAETVKTAYGSSLIEGLKASGSAMDAIVKDQADRRGKIEIAAREKAVADGMSNKDGAAFVKKALNDFDTATDDKGNNKLDAEKAGVANQALRSTAESLSATLTDLGPEGAAISSVISGALIMADAYATFGDSAETAADKAQMAGAAVAAISQIMAANSKAQISEIDKQIEAEKKRDGKSKESVAKIKQMEKKKEAMQKKAFDQNKKMQMAQTIIATATGMMRAYQDFDGFTATALATMIGALGAAQLAIISKTQFAGGASSSIEKPSMQSLTVGKRDNKVDVSRGASGGELAYMRGARGTGTNANNFTPTGGAYGMRNYAAGGEGILVGEQGPEVVTPTQPVDVMPANMGGAQNVNFTINAVDAEGIESVLENQRGNIIGMIRSAANGYGTRFLEEVDTDVVSSGGYQKA